MADQETKFTEDELKSLQDLQTSYQQKQLQFGQLEVQRLLVKQQVDALAGAKSKLEEDYAGIQETEQRLVKQLNEKYGPGNLDPATGVFTSAPTEEVEPATTEEASETT
jgi:hypothetical protein